MRMPSASAALREAGWYGWPSSSMVPVVAGSSPQMIFDSVLLPAPFSPVSASTSPPRTASSTSRSTGVT
jgi:hypothetical protein